ncbi:exo-beta-N-acetylmuramidase NamZ family protein [Phycicoccus avicenniae]|uniref:exo-beta-N-acetylmuramidase NamZ family protein n=1 Tax=Phycicoccus avicenniae TaxID=2828860 RepID=UPI003D27706B
MTSLDRRTLFAATALGATAATVGAAAPASATPGRGHGKGVLPGADRAAADRWKVLRGRKVGVVTNPTGVLKNLHSIVDEMHASGAVDLKAVFGPEHGFRGTAQAGEAEETHTDPRTGVTVYDAYGATADSLTRMVREAGVDTLVFDIQDVGARFYTYIWTMYTAMRAALRAGAEFVVLDRPNPIGGTARGPMMTTAFTTGVGAKEIVQAHGMTVGELARFFDGEFLEAEEGKTFGERLHVVEVSGWTRDTVFADTGLTWVLPSPNMPTPDTASVYTGTCLFEGTNLSEGRGTTAPFQLVGAPFVDNRWAERLEARGVPGVAFREAYFNPVVNKFVGQVCGGVQVHVTDPGRLDGPRLGAEMLVAAKALYADFAWRKDSYDPARPYWIDKLTGSPRLREMVDAGASADEVVGAWKAELAAFDRRRKQYLLYRGGRR